MGINADELGYTVKPTKLPNCPYPVVTIALYDTASGGAGFASSAHRDFPELFERAKKYLDCTCPSVCQNCLLGFDTRFHIDQLDRHLALAFLDDDFIRALALPNELKLLGPNSRWTPESLFTEIRQAADQGASELRLFLHGETDAWELLGNLRGYLTQWQSLYSELVLVLVNIQPEQLSGESKEDLWVLSRLGIRIAVLEKSKQNPSCPAFAQAIRTAASSQQAMVWTWACIGPGGILANENWLEASENLLIFATDYPLLPVRLVMAADSLKPPAGTGDVEIEILTECNGNLNNFGEKFWHLIADKHQTLQQHLTHGDHLQGISYCDRYLYSPWTLILIAELISGLKQILGKNWSQPVIQITTAPKLAKDGYQKKGLWADWLDDGLRLAVMAAYFANMGENCQATAKTDTPHGRFLRLKWQSGKTTVLRFDQGVGYWSCANRPPYFDNTLSANDQANVLLSGFPSLNIKNHKDFPTQIFVKER